MSDLKATEFEEILGGDFSTPCYVNKEDSFNQAISVRRPIIVLYGEEAVRGMAEFIEIAKKKKIIGFSDKISTLASKIGFVMTVIDIAVGAPVVLIKEELKLIGYGLFVKMICNNANAFKDYHLMIDEKQDRIVLLSKEISKDDFSAILKQIQADFSKAMAEGISNYENIFKIDEIFTVTGHGTILSGVVIKGTFSVNDRVTILDGKLKEYATENILDIEKFRALVEKVSEKEECGILIGRNDALKQEIEKQKLLLRDVYIVK